MVQLAYYQQKLKQGYDTNVRARPLAPNDLVLRKVVGTAKKAQHGEGWDPIGRGHIVLPR